MPPKGKTENDEGLLEYLEDIIVSVLDYACSRKDLIQ